MAKYCDKWCYGRGSICDHCKHYIDDGNKKKGEFEGEGLCKVKNVRVDALDYCEDDFECVLVEDESYIDPNYAADCIKEYYMK